MKFVAKGLIDNILALVQIMAWRRPGDKPLSEPMMFSLQTHLCVTRPQWIITWEKIIAFWAVSLYNRKGSPTKDFISTSEQKCNS